MIVSIEHDGSYLLEPMRMNSVTHRVAPTPESSGLRQETTEEVDHILVVNDVDAYHGVGFDQQTEDEINGMIAKYSGEDYTDCFGIMHSDTENAILLDGAVSVTDDNVSDFELVNACFSLGKNYSDQQHGYEE